MHSKCNPHSRYGPGSRSVGPLELPYNNNIANTAKHANGIKNEQGSGSWFICCFCLLAVIFTQHECICKAMFFSFCLRHSSKETTSLFHLTCWCCDTKQMSSPARRAKLAAQQAQAAAKTAEKRKCHVWLWWRCSVLN